MENSKITKILFVCLGNICRSPAAQTVMEQLVESKGLQSVIECGKIIKDPEEQRQYCWHPHSSDSYRTEDCYSNVMFMASDKLSFNENMPGAGVLTFREDRVLTAPNCNKATWVKRSVYDVDSVIGNRKNSSKIADGIYYAGIWQELGLKKTPECEEWAKSIVQ